MVLLTHPEGLKNRRKPKATENNICPIQYWVLKKRQDVISTIENKEDNNPRERQKKKNIEENYKNKILEKKADNLSKSLIVTYSQKFWKVKIYVEYIISTAELGAT